MVRTHILIALATVFIAAFTLFYIFDNLGKLYDLCKTGAAPPICQQLNSFTFSLIVILLIIGGFIIIVSVIAYVLISAG